MTETRGVLVALLVIVGLAALVAIPLLVLFRRSNHWLVLLAKWLLVTLGAFLLLMTYAQRLNPQYWIDLWKGLAGDHHPTRSSLRD